MLQVASALARFQSVLMRNIGKPVGLTVIGAFAVLTQDLIDYLLGDDGKAN